MVPNPAVSTRAATSRSQRRPRSRCDGAARADLRQHRRSTTRRCSANFRAGRSSNCFRSIATGSAAGIVCGERFDGPWANVGTPAELGRARRGAAAPIRDVTAADDHCDADRRMDATAIRCSTFRACRASTRSGPSTSRRPSTRCSREARAAVDARRDRPRRPRPGTTSSSRSPTRSTGSIARGARCSHLNAVVNTPELRDAYNANLPEGHRVLHRPRAGPAPVRALSRAAPRRRRSRRSTRRSASSIDNELRDFRLGGAELARRQQGALQGRAGGARGPVGAVRRQRARRDQRLGALRRRRGRAWPACRRRASPKRAPRREADGRSGWKLTLRMPCYLPVHAVRGQPRRCARRCIAPTRRAPPTSARIREWDNTPVIARILALRREAAPLLGYANYAEVSLVPKMAQDAGEVLAFLRDLARAREALRRARFRRARRLRARRARPRDARSRGTSRTPSEQLKAARYAFSEQEVRAVLSRGQGARRTVPRRRDDLRRRDPRSDARRLASGRALLRRHRSRRRACRPVLPRPLRARRTSRAAPGWTTRSTAAAPARVSSIRSRT